MTNESQTTHTNACNAYAKANLIDEKVKRAQFVRDNFPSIVERISLAAQVEMLKQELA